MSRRLEPGTRIRITWQDALTADGRNVWDLRSGIYVDWDGHDWRACRDGLTGETRKFWPMGLLPYINAINSVSEDCRTNIDCAIEQMIADGTMPGIDEWPW